MSMRSNEMRTSNKVRSYKNSKPSLLQIIGVKRLILILALLICFFGVGFALLQWKDNKELIAQQEAAEQAELDDNYLNYMLSILDDYYGFSYQGTIDNADFSYSDKHIMRQLSNLSQHYTISGVCKEQSITGELSYIANEDTVYYTAFTSNKNGVYYDVSNYCETSVANYRTLNDRENVYWSLLDHTYNISYPAGPFYSTSSLYDYIRGILEAAKQNKDVELAKSQTDQGNSQYSAKIPSKLFAGDNPLASLFVDSESPVVCSVYSLGGNSGGRQFYIGLQQDDLTIQLTLTENTTYSTPNPIYAVSEEQFLNAVQSIEAKVQAIADEKAKKEAEKEKKKKKKDSDKENAEDSSSETTEAATEVAE